MIGIGINAISAGRAVFFPARPSGLTATQDGADVDLAWTDNATDEAGYRIYRSDDGEAFAEIDDIAANSEAYTDLDPGAGEWWYYVAAYNAAGQAKSNVTGVEVTE